MRPSATGVWECYDGTCANAMVSEPICTPASTTVLPMCIYTHALHTYIHIQGKKKKKEKNIYWVVKLIYIIYVHVCILYMYIIIYRERKEKGKRTFVGNFFYYLRVEWDVIGCREHRIVALTYADVCWRMLTYADVCWRMLTYADVCWRCCREHRMVALQKAFNSRAAWRMLTYADVCWRMLTYADVVAGSIE